MSYTNFGRHALRGGIAVTLLAGACTTTFFAIADDEDERRASAANSADLVITGYVGSVRIREGRALDWELDMGEGLVPAVSVSEQSGRLIVDGGLEEGPDRCENTDRRFELQMEDGPRRPISAFPELVITMPAGSDYALEIMGGQMEMAGAANLSLDYFGCGDVKFGDVTDILNLSVYGSGDVEGGSTGPAHILIRGSGDVVLGDIDGDAEIQIYGSGDVDVGEISGDTTLKIQGSGDIGLGSVQNLLTVDVAGSGDVDIGSGLLAALNIDVFGSGDVQFNGEANDVSVLLKGSGDVYVARSNGNRVVNRYGSGDVRIGSWRSDDDD